MRYFFKKQQRVIRGSTFTLALRRGICAADGTLVVFAIATSPAKPPRLGVTIPKKTGNAVIRNRWKRLIRESFRTQQEQLPHGFDFIARPKKGAQPSWSKVKASIPRLARKAAAKNRP